MKCSETLAITEKLCPSASSGRVFSTSSSVSAFRLERNRWSISFQPGTSTVFPLAVNSFPAQENTAVTVSYSWGAATAQSSLEQTRFICPAAYRRNAAAAGRRTYTIGSSASLCWVGKDRQLPRPSAHPSATEQVLAGTSRSPFSASAGTKV